MKWTGTVPCWIRAAQRGTPQRYRDNQSQERIRNKLFFFFWQSTQQTRTWRKPKARLETRGLYLLVMLLYNMHRESWNQIFVHKHIVCNWCCWCKVSDHHHHLNTALMRWTAGTLGLRPPQHHIAGSFQIGCTCEMQYLERSQLCVALSENVLPSHSVTPSDFFPKCTLYPQFALVVVMTPNTISEAR